MQTKRSMSSFGDMAFTLGDKLLPARGSAEFSTQGRRFLSGRGSIDSLQPTRAGDDRQQVHVYSKPWEEPLDDGLPPQISAVRVAAGRDRSGGAGDSGLLDLQAAAEEASPAPDASSSQGATAAVRPQQAGGAALCPPRVRTPVGRSVTLSVLGDKSRSSSSLRGGMPALPPPARPPPRATPVALETIEDVAAQTSGPDLVKQPAANDSLKQPAANDSLIEGAAAGNADVQLHEAAAQVIKASHQDDPTSSDSAEPTAAAGKRGPSRGVRSAPRRGGMGIASLASSGGGESSRNLRASGSLLGMFGPSMGKASNDEHSRIWKIMQVGVGPGVDVEVQAGRCTNEEGCPAV